MNKESDSDIEIDERIKTLKNKYLPKRNHVSGISNTFGLTSEDAGSKKLREMRDYKTVLRELNRALSDQHKSNAVSDEDDDDGLEETNILYTETDVTLPSNLAHSSSSCESNSRRREVMDGPQSSCSGAAAVHVYQEMLHIYEKLQAERVSQQVWSAELCDRERELQRRENELMQHQRDIDKLRGAEEEMIKDIRSLQQRYQQETNELKEALKQKTKDIKRIKSSFDSMKELNDSLKKQLHDVTEQNKKLESQSGKVQARLENLQRRYEYSKTHGGRENVFPKAYQPKPSKQENPSMNKTNKEGGAHGPAVKLISALLDWVVDERLIEPGEKSNLTACQSYGTSRPSLHHRCSTVLPVLVELLQKESTMMESSLQLSVLRCVYCCLTQLQHSTQYAPLTSTLRRLGEEVSRGSGDPVNGRQVRPCPLFKSSCLHTRLLCSLIIIKSISQVDILAQALDVLLCAVRTDEGQQLFLHYGALSAVLSMLRVGGPALLMLSVDLLLQMSTQSRFLEECSTEEFFRCVSLFLRKPRLDPAVLEKISVLLQKLSGIRKNKRLFEASSLHLLLLEIHRSADPSQTFLIMNLSSILLNLDMLTRS